MLQQEEEEEMEVSEEEEVEYEEVSEEVEEEEVEYEEVSEEVSEEEEVEYEEVSEEEEEVEEEDQNPNPRQKPSFVESISNLQSFHGALSEFLSHYNSLQQTLDCISTFIDAKSNIKPIKIEENPIKIEDNPVKIEDKQYTELEYICRTNDVETLRNYVSTRLSEIDRLRKEVPEALKLSSDPAKLVLDAMGRFYLSRTYELGDTHAIDTRHASRFYTRHAGILLLEFYLIAGCPVAENQNALASVKESAREAAVSWRSRLISEGGLEAASAVDALGLVLLLASFGVPSEFIAKDLYSLLRLSNLKKKGDVLRISAILVQKMPDIIKDLTAKNMHVEAVDLICAFGLEEKFPLLPLLSSFVKRACETGADERRQGQCSLLKLAYKKELAALKSVLKCLEDHKLDATELANLKIEQKIAKCEKGILEGEQKLQDKNLKRRFGDIEPLKNQDNQIKQLRPSAQASHGPLPQSIRQFQEQGITATPDSRYAYNGYILNDKPLSSEASGLVARDSMGLLPQSVHGQGGGLYGSAVYQNSGEHNLLGTAYPSGHDFTRYSAATGQSFHQPPASEQSFYQPPASQQNYYQPPASGQHYYQLAASGQNSNQQPASGQNSYPPHASSVVTGGRNLYQFAGNILERELPNYSTTSNVVPTASTITNPTHQTSYTG